MRTIKTVLAYIEMDVTDGPPDVSDLRRIASTIVAELSSRHNTHSSGQGGDSTCSSYRSFFREVPEGTPWFNVDIATDVLTSANLVARATHRNTKPYPRIFNHLPITGEAMTPLERLFAFLAERAKNGQLATYEDAGQVVNLDAGSYELWHLLGEVSRLSTDTHGCMLSALVISNGVNSNHRGSPGNEFYELAEKLGRGPAVASLGRLAFWAKEVRIVHEKKW